MRDDCPAAEPDFVPVLRRLGVLNPGEPVRGQRPAGGVPSDIWRIESDSGPVCVKRAGRRSGGKAALGHVLTRFAPLWTPFDACFRDKCLI